MTTRRDALLRTGLLGLSGLAGVGLSSWPGRVAAAPDTQRPSAPRLAKPALAPATAWPDRPVRMVVPFPPGGSTDVLSRIFAEELRQKLGQPFMIDNRPGAAGNIGIAEFVRAPADGSVVASATIGNYSINQYLYRHMGYQPETDLAPASLAWEMPNVAVVATEHVPARTLEEFIAWAKKQPQGVIYGSPGVGSSPHLTAEMFRMRAGINATHLPFRGAAETIPAMLRGDVQFAIDNLASYLPTIQQGRMRALAVTSKERWPRLPDVPTMGEAGLADFVVTSWAAFAFPRGVPAPILQKMSDTVQQIAAAPATQQRFIEAGAWVLASTPEQAADRAAQERPMWKQLVAASGARLD